MRALDLTVGDAIEVAMWSPDGTRVKRKYRVTKMPYGSSRSARLNPGDGYLDEEVFLQLKEVDPGEVK